MTPALPLPDDTRPTAPPETIHLRSGGVSVVIENTGSGLPTIAHWGADLGPLSDRELADFCASGRPAYRDTAFDTATDVRVLPEHAAAWVGRPGLTGSRSGRDWSATFPVVGLRHEQRAGGGERVVTEAFDDVAGLRVSIELELSSEGLLRVRTTLTNTGSETYTLGALRQVLPVAAVATELMDFTGRHLRERIPQRFDFTAGVHTREARNGRTGLDAAYLLLAGRHGFSFEQGEVWGVHLGWSGNQEVYAERSYNGAQVLGGGEYLDHGEVRLGASESYRTPWLYGCYGVGLNQLGDRFHAFLRGLAVHPVTPRPVLLNTWEAVYFDQRLPKLVELADRAAAIGVERFVLDDGWFSGRRDDTSSLGDWWVSEEMWPDGLDPLVDHVTGLGLQFGLWVEPEMVNLDSELARTHPGWLFSAGGRTGLASRHQHVLDLGHPGAFDHIKSSLTALLDRYPISYLKWDHNRLLNDAGHTPGGEPGVHRHTLAVYRLMAELLAEHPGLEIESCSAGGGRIDLGVMELASRVWPSDCIDPLERQQIIRYTRLLLPPELLGTHIGSERSHTTGRRHDLSFRGATALWGHLGIEWDLTELDQNELDALAGWVRLHQELRPLLHSGVTVTVDHPDPAIWISGVIAQDGNEAVFGVTALTRSVTWPPGRGRLPGLLPDQAYRVEVEPLSLTGLGHGVLRPAWVDDGVVLTGRALATAGVQLLPLDPEHSYLLRIRSVS